MNDGKYYRLKESDYYKEKMRIINPSTKILLHIPDGGIYRKDLVKEMGDTRGLSKIVAELIVESTLRSNLIVKEGRLIKRSPNLIYV